MTFSRVNAKFIVHYRGLFNEMMRMTNSYDLAPTWYASGWGSLESQRARFEAISRLISKTPTRILDVGCGTGDLYGYLREKKLPYSYVGIDLLPEMIQFAKQKFPDATFIVGDIFELDTGPLAPDFVIASGLLQFRDPEDEDYHKSAIEYLWNIPKSGLVMNILSDLRELENKIPEELYLSPVDTLEFLFSLSKFAVLDHSYHPGLGDFTIAVYKRSPISWKRPEFTRWRSVDGEA